MSRSCLLNLSTRTAIGPPNVVSMSTAGGYLALIDGYNVIKQHAVWSAWPLARARQQLVTVLAHVRWPMPVSRIDVIFDAARHATTPSQQHGIIRITFVGPTADAMIQRMIQINDHPERLLVISNDRAILHTAKTHGTLRYPVSWLMARSRPSHVGLAAQPLDCEEAKLTYAQARQVNQELAVRWGLHA